MEWNGIEYDSGVNFINSIMFGWDITFIFWELSNKELFKRFDWNKI
jgi:hypothetical protein